MEIKINGVDIYKEVSVNRCILEQFFGKFEDKLSIRFNDSKMMWHDWGLEAGDSIDVTECGVRSGKMVVRSVSLSNGFCEVEAGSSVFTSSDPQQYIYRDATLSGIVESIAGRQGLKLSIQSKINQSYPYLCQRNESDFQFLERIFRLEGLCFLVFDGRLVVYIEREFEAASPVYSIEIDADAIFSMSKSRAIKECITTNGSAEGSFSVDSGFGRVRESVVCDADESELSRYAQNILRSMNRDSKVVKYATKHLISDLSPGSMVKISGGAKEFDGPFFVTKTRHDFFKNESEFSARAPLNY